MVDQERHDLALEMVTVLPRYGSWAVNLRHLAMPLATPASSQPGTLPPDDRSSTSPAPARRRCPGVIPRHDIHEIARVSAHPEGSINHLESAGYPEFAAPVNQNAYTAPGN